MSPSRKAIVERKRAWLAARATPSAPPLVKPLVAITAVTATAVEEPVSKRSYVIVTVETDAGVAGVGEASAHPDPHAAVRRILAQSRQIVGQDAIAFEVVRRSLLAGRGAVPRDHGDIQGAINMALVDILGKLAKAPVHEVLGGPTRTKARAMAGFDASSDADLNALVQGARQAGFRAFALPLVKCPAFASRTTSDGQFRAGGRAFFREMRRFLEGVRQAVGTDADFVLDCGGRLTPAQATGLARELERFHLLWLEEPTGSIHRKMLAGISAESVTPVGYGREITANGDFQELLRLDAVDILRPDVRSYGITQIRKAAALAETYYVAMAPYHRGGPVATAAALHVAASIPNFFIQEIPYAANPADRRMRRELAGGDLETVNEGFVALPEAPGLGVAVHREALEKYRVKA